MLLDSGQILGLLILIKNKKPMKKQISISIFIFLFFVALSFNSPLYGQGDTNADEMVVNGTVTSQQDGEVLPGVNIIVQGTSIGTTTNADGEYTIEVPSQNSTLVFSFIGFQSQEIQVNGRNTIDVEMESGTAQLDDLVVTGYGTQKQSEITGSVGMVSADDLEQTSFNTMQELRGKVAGVNIFTNSGSPTGSNRVVIRGMSTINASSDPLYVVDGVVRENIDFLSPNSIESIEVLKDASSTAIYGSRGANGVVLITTERGDSVDELTVGYEGNFSVGNLRKKMDLLNADEFVEVLERGYENAPKYDDYPSGEEPSLDLDDPRLFDENGNPLYDTDWQEEATRTALSHNHQLSLQTGGEKSSLSAALGFTDQEGIMLNSYMERINAKLTYDADPTDWLTIGTNLSVNKISENSIQEGGGNQMPRRSMIEMPPIFPVQFDNGEWSNTFSIEDDLGFEGIPNPVHVLETRDRIRDRTNLFGNSYLEFQITSNLEFRTQLGFENRLFESRDYEPTDLINISAPDGDAAIGNTDTFYWQSENYLTYQKEVGNHSINSVLGASWQARNYRSNNVSASGFSDDFYRFNDIGTATDPDPPTSYTDEWSMNSYFTRFNYTFDDKYSATFTGRVDGSSRFGENSKYGVFPSIGVAWLASDENFMQDIDFIDLLRIRSSYGVTGNSEIGVYNSLATINSGTTLIGGARQSSSYVERLANPDLEWEKTHQFNIGLELDLFNQIVSIEGDYYQKMTNDLLLDRPVPTTTGFGSITDNIGSVSNKGVDLMITTQNLRTPDYLWNTTLNLNYNQNTIESLGAEDEDIFPGPNWVSGSQTILRVGESLGSFWGFERQGTYNIDEVDEGTPGTAKRSDDRQILGNGLPDWTGSFINKFNIKNFDLTVDLQFVYGVEIVQQFLHSTEDRTGYANGLSTILSEGWTEDNQNTMVQEIRNAPLSGQDSQLDSQWVVDGSYIRGNLFAVGYTFDSSSLNSWGLKDLRVYANLENAFVIHSDDFKGHDPESTSWEGNQWGQNIFFFQYPKPRTFSMGVNVRF